MNPSFPVILSLPFVIASPFLPVIASPSPPVILSLPFVIASPFLPVIASRRRGNLMGLLRRYHSSQ